MVLSSSPPQREVLLPPLAEEKVVKRHGYGLVALYWVSKSLWGSDLTSGPQHLGSQPPLSTDFGKSHRLLTLAVVPFAFLCGSVVASSHALTPPMHTG